MVRRALVILCVLLAAFPAFSASTSLAKGEALFIQNQPRDAEPLLEMALNDDPSNEKVYLYLGIVYQQLGNLDKAIDVLTDLGQAGAQGVRRRRAGRTGRQRRGWPGRAGCPRR